MNEAFEQKMKRVIERRADRALETTRKEPASTSTWHPMLLLRLRLGLTQKEMVKAIGIPWLTVAYLNDIETGKSKASRDLLDACEMLAFKRGVSDDIVSFDLRSPHVEREPRVEKPKSKTEKTMVNIPSADAKYSPLPDTEKIPEFEIEHHDAQLGTLMMRLDDEATALLQEAHSLTAGLHRGCDAAEKAKANKGLSYKLSTLSHSIGELKMLAFQIEVDEPIKPMLNPNLSAEAQAWQVLLIARPVVDEIRSDDLRMGELISPLLQLAGVEDVSTPHLSDAIRAVIERHCDPLDSVALTKRLREARERIEELSGLCFEQERDEFLAIISRRFNVERNTEIVTRRYGWDGRPAGTLQEVADEYGVSRERIRQICGPFERELDKQAKRRLFAPVLDRVLASLSQRAPLAKPDAQAALRDFPDITEPLDISDLLRWANWMGRGKVLSIEEITQPSPATNYLVHPASNSQSAHQIHIARATVLKIAHKTVSRWGVAQFDDIAAKATEYCVQHNFVFNFDITNIEEILAARSDLHWLGVEQGWFWFSDTAHNGLLTQIEKIFAVTSRVSISELREGVARHHRREGFAPPRKVLLELCRQMPGLSVEDDEVFLDPPHDLSAELSFNEAILWEVLKAHGEVIARPALEKLCAARGMNRVTFYLYLNSSPIIARYADGVFGLRGAQPTPNDIEAAIENLGAEYSRLRRRVLKEHGWTNDGEIWLSYKLSQGILNSGNAAFPSALKNFLQGSFALQNFNGDAAGTLTFGPSQAWGLGPFLRRSGAEAGDHLLLVFNLQTKTARVALGDESLLEELPQRDEEVLGVTTNESVKNPATLFDDFDELEIRELFVDD